MPCYLFSWHAYGTWMPDRSQGYVKRGMVLPRDAHEAAKYRARQKESTAEFDDAIQQVIVDELVVTAQFRRFRLHGAATDPTHVHVLVSWSDERSYKMLRRGVRESLTRRLKREQHRNWFTHRGSRKRVVERSHFNYLMDSYLANHRGWKWDERRGKCR